LALIGPNGAGKTSLLNCISGIYQATQGKMVFQGTDLVGLKPHDIARIGVARTFQHAELFRHMTVLQNILVGRHMKMKRGLILNGVFWGKAINEEAAQREEIEKIIDFLELMESRRSWDLGGPSQWSLKCCFSMNPLPE
jgi:branched-chain amino acid transport system ATP-binding protein